MPLFTWLFQVIEASAVPKGEGLGFGKAIAGGIDIDGNLYPGNLLLKNLLFSIKRYMLFS